MTRYLEFRVKDIPFKSPLTTSQGTKDLYANQDPPEWMSQKRYTNLENRNTILEKERKILENRNIILEKDIQF